LASKELIDDAKLGCIDLIFKDIYMELLTKVQLVPSNGRFEELTFLAAERMKEKMIPSSGRRVRIG
jgi:hypothetical protein